MNLVPFTAPSLTQVVTIQNVLTPLHWSMRRPPEWRQGLKVANAALSDGPPVAQSTLATRVLGEVSYLFCHKSDPTGFARMIVAKGKVIGANFELTNTDERKWLKILPLVIAAHEPGEGQTVSTRLYLKANTLMPVAGRDNEFYGIDDITRGSEALRQVSLLLWSGLGVQVEVPKKKRVK